MTFLGPPTVFDPSPSSFSFFNSSAAFNSESSKEQNNLLSSNGRKIMIFKDILASEDESMTYFSPFTQ